MSKKSGHVPATFRDAGTSETFEGGQEHSFERGAYDNYLAAGLISQPESKAKAERPTAKNTPRRRKPAAKTAAPARQPAPSSQAILPSDSSAE